jgi:hypothetical protein
LRRALLLTAILTLAVLTITPAASAQASDIVRDGWTFKDWDHLGNYLKGNVQAESWVDLDWPCGPPRDPEYNCAIIRARGHGLVKKIYKVVRTEIGLVRLGRYPAGTLVENERNKNSGSLSQIEQRTAWYPVTSDACAITFRIWTRTSFAVRWSDARLSKLSLLSEPTDAQVCDQAAMTRTQRQQLRTQLLS